MEAAKKCSQWRKSLSLNSNQKKKKRLTYTCPGLMYYIHEESD